MNLPAKRIALHVILPLITGLIIYIVARPETWLVQKLFPVRDWFVEKGWTISSTGWFTKILLFNGPDFCWSYSLTSALLFWKFFSGVKQAYFPVFIFLVILLQEIVQVLFTTHFTFDIMDIVAAVLAFLLSVLLNRKYA